jgi:ketosteroid isomerase-like protein
MMKCKLNLKNQKDNAQFNYRASVGAGIVMIAVWLISIGCSNLEGDLNVEKTETTTEIDSTSTVPMSRSAGKKCVSIDQEVTDRFHVYVAAFIAEDVDKLYSDFWTPEYHEFTPNFDKSREELRESMTSFYGNGGNLTSYTWQSLERSVYSDVVYDIGVYNNAGDVNGAQFVINGYYFLRWIKGQDDIWRVHKVVAGPRGNTSEVNPTDQGILVCYNFGQHRSNVGINQQIANRSEAYAKALTSGNADEIYKFLTEDFHFYGDGLDVDRDGLYEHYRHFFATGHIVSSNIRLHYRFMHGNVVYDIGQSDNTVVVDGVQSVKKNNYVIRWLKGHDGVWRIDRIMDLFRR